ncbi:membrane protein [Bradyrhizobium sp. SSBR45G]|uniref:YitT family protein n=1 Tax=unclassified Bradyrhizobium TaxID=2631580 RepID=UPI0023429522|nr:MULTISPECIES: YitT family protein [unclassified Bradyrhizobium]GLH75220.1 membrane protein [Bradyrhizobium sp. SSBR45G]GLH82993.1 membrane protein [Bradyrhizobium sp. SSBR45R]
MTEMVLQERHKLYEDAMALTLGTLFVSLGMLIYSKTVLLVGSTAGLSLLLSYVTGYGFGLSFFLINLPFYALAIRRMGWPFTIRTFVAVGLVAVFSRLTASWVDISHIDPVYATVIGAGLTGTGLLMLFRHRTGLGGVNILALYLQENWKIRAGYFQLGVDALIMIAAFFVIPVDRLALSILGIVIVNVIIAINHKPGRYMALS